MDGFASNSQWVRLINAALGFFYPEVCQVCGAARATPAQGYVCCDCAQQVKFITRPFCERCGLPYEGDITTEFKCSNCSDTKLHFCWARSAVAAGGLILELIHRYKYQRALWFEPFLGELFVRVAAPELSRGKWDVIVPVPLHPAKQREREFNQAERLARHLARATGIPVNEKLLVRIVPTRTQTLLTRAERAANVRRAFRARPGRRLDGRRVVIVDDVFTTGATTNACAAALRAAGAGEICVWTLARGLARPVLQA